MTLRQLQLHSDTTRRAACKQYIHERTLLTAREIRQESDSEIRAAIRDIQDGINSNGDGCGDDELFDNRMVWS